MATAEFGFDQLINHEAVAMGLDFLANYGGRRLRRYIEQPPLDTNDNAAEGEDKGPKANLAFELAPDAWVARPVASEPPDPTAMPQRYIDGCHYGTWGIPLDDPLRHPIPVRLAEVGGVCMRMVGRSLRREYAHIERIVCFLVDPFPWHEIEDFALALYEKLNMRLLAASPPRENGDLQKTFDFATRAQWTYTQTQEEMRNLEELALNHDRQTLSLVDGPLMRIEHPLAIGVIKQHRGNYLGAEAKCWQVLYGLEPGQRTPAFQIASPRPRVSWYLKLDGAHGSMPNWGFVRVEISQEHFERYGSDRVYLDRLSNALFHLRCRQRSYARAPVSMGPIVHAEESLKSLLAPPAALAQWFYHQTNVRRGTFGGFNDE
jgi:hypothetical protein